LVEDDAAVLDVTCSAKSEFALAELFVAAGPVGLETNYFSRGFAADKFNLSVEFY
jgi:hypothetical protein